ncbi:MAG: hypothetical protein ACI8W1_000625, partial [Candidatus Azotimanducaceae bacterium]
SEPVDDHGRIKLVQTKSLPVRCQLTSHLISL